MLYLPYSLFSRGLQSNNNIHDFVSEFMILDLLLVFKVELAVVLTELVLLFVEEENKCEWKIGPGF